MIEREIVVQGVRYNNWTSFAVLWLLGRETSELDGADSRSTGLTGCSSLGERAPGARWNRWLGGTQSRNWRCRLICHSAHSQVIIPTALSWLVYGAFSCTDGGKVWAWIWVSYVQSTSSAWIVRWYEGLDAVWSSYVLKVEESDAKSRQVFPFQLQELHSAYCFFDGGFIYFVH